MDNGEHLNQYLPPDPSSDDANQNYFTSLCTVFVATIQEAKDRVSQLEFIFCSQLFPTFQSELTKFRNLSKRLEKIKQDAEEEWKQNKKYLLLELDKLQTRNDRMEEQIQLMKTTFEREKKEFSSAFELEKEELNRKHSLEREQLVSTMGAVQRSDDEILKVKEELQQRLEEIAEGKLLQEKLFQQVSKMDEELQIERLRQNLQVSELERERKSKQDILEQFKNLKRMYKGLRAQYDVILKLNGMGTEKNLSAKKKVQNDSYTSSDNLKQASLYDYQAQATEGRKARMLSEDKEVDINTNGNPMEVDMNSNGNPKETYHEATLNFENRSENVKNGEFFARPYSLKKDLDDHEVNSDLNKNFERTESNESPSKTVINSPKYVPFEDEETQEQAHDVSKEAEIDDFRVVKEKKELLVPSLQQKEQQKRPLEPKSWPPNLSRLKNSSWRETRLRKEPGKGVDPHDSFLDTPMEAVIQSVKQKLDACVNKPKHRNPNVEDRSLFHGEVRACQINQNDVLMNSDMSDYEDDDETQAIDPDNAQQMSHAKSPDMSCNLGGTIPENSNNRISNRLGKLKEQNQRHVQKDSINYKYIEPIRKKADREALKGVECKQCKKFYDAVGGDDANATNRCEHHNEVSRHRYRYVPPATPEGFWNIGFDSDL